jgi:hypothetical protein
MLLVGIGALLFVPLFKSITHLPPFMGMLLSLGIVWVVSELINPAQDEIEKESIPLRVRSRVSMSPAFSPELRINFSGNGKQCKKAIPSSIIKLGMEILT